MAIRDQSQNLPEASERCPHPRVALSGPSPHSRAAVFSAPEKEPFPKAQLRRLGCFFPSMPRASSSPPTAPPLDSAPNCTLTLGWDTVPFAVRQCSRQKRPVSVPAATPGQGDKGPVPRLPPALTLTVTLTWVGLPGTEDHVCIHGSPAQRVEETRRAKEQQCGRGVSGEERWEGPKQTVLKSRLA